MASPEVATTRTLERSGPPIDGSDPELDLGATRISFTMSELSGLRRAVAAQAARAQLDDERAGDLVIAVNELAINSVCHGGGQGTASIWLTEDALLCEIRDAGFIRRMRRERPGPAALSGRGLWLVEHLCDHVEIRSSQDAGSCVRVAMRLGRIGIAG